MLYRYLMELGIAKEMPLFGHMPYVMGQGNKKLSKRDPESNLFNHRDNGFIREACSTTWPARLVHCTGPRRRSPWTR